MLSRWHQAFPRGVYLGLNAPAYAASPADILWLRLQAGVPLRDQLTAARARIPHPSYVVLSDLPNDDEALAALALGARGYCNSHASAEVLQQIATVVMQGGLWVGQSVMQKLVALSAQASAPAAGKDWKALLSQREREVAEILVVGASNKEIAARLAITERTVKSHISTIFEKLNVRDRLQLAVLIRKGASA